MSVKLIVMDMDGTLLTGDKVISENTYSKLMEVQSQGVKLALASGRSINRLQEYADKLHMKENNGYIIEGNGVAYFDYKENLHVEGMRCGHENAQEIIDFLEPLNIELLVMGESDAYIILAKDQKESFWLKHSQVENIQNREINYIKSIEEVNQRINKVCVCGEKETINHLCDYLQGINPKFWHGKIMPHWVEIHPKEISKGNALAKIMKEYHYSKEEVLVFGDGENDISMLEVGMGIAMGNALDSVKEICYAICGSNNEDGIAKYLTQVGC